MGNEQTNQPPRVGNPKRPTRSNLIFGIGMKVRKKFLDGKYYDGEVVKYDDVNQYYQIKYQDGDMEEFDHNEMKKYYKYHQQHHGLAAGGNIWDPTLGKMCAYRDLIKHPESKIRTRWLKAGENEFGRLFDGYQPNEVKGMDVLEWIKPEDIPTNKTATYPRFTIADRPEKEERYRCRITAGGDRLTYDGDVSTKTSSMETFKCLLNSVVSTPGARMFTGDISNMYLCSTLPEPEYVKFHPSEIYPQIFRESDAK